MVKLATARRLGGAAVIILAFGSIASCGGNAPQSNGGHPLAGGSSSGPVTPSDSGSPSGTSGTKNPGSSPSGSSPGQSGQPGDQSGQPGGQSGQPGGQPGGPGGTGGQPTDQPTSQPTTWPTTWPSTSPSYQPPPVPAVPSCSTANLRGTIGSPGVAGSSTYYAIILKNVSGSTCTLYGYPGVALVQAIGGPLVGGVADWDPGTSLLVTLKPGEFASATLRAADVSAYPPQCRPKPANYLQVFPPGQFTALYLSLRLATCTGQMPGGGKSTIGIQPLRPGAAG